MDDDLKRIGARRRQLQALLLSERLLHARVWRVRSESRQHTLAVACLQNLKNHTKTSTPVPLLNTNALDGWNIYSRRMMQETPRKYNKPANLHQKKKYLKEGPRLHGNIWSIRKMGIVKWGLVV